MSLGYDSMGQLQEEIRELEKKNAELRTRLLKVMDANQLLRNDLAKLAARNGNDPS